MQVGCVCQENTGVDVLRFLGRLAMGFVVRGGHGRESHRKQWETLKDQ